MPRNGLLIETIALVAELYGLILCFKSAVERKSTSTFVHIAALKTRLVVDKEIRKICKGVNPESQTRYVLSKPSANWAVEAMAPLVLASSTTTKTFSPVQAWLTKQLSVRKVVPTGSTMLKRQDACSPYQKASTSDINFFFGTWTCSQSVLKQLTTTSIERQPDNAFRKTNLPKPFRPSLSRPFLQASCSQSMSLGFPKDIDCSNDITYHTTSSKYNHVISLWAQNIPPGITTNIA